MTSFRGGHSQRAFLLIVRYVCDFVVQGYSHKLPRPRCFPGRLRVLDVFGVCLCSKQEGIHQTARKTDSTLQRVDTSAFFRRWRRPGIGQVPASHRRGHTTCGGREASKGGNTRGEQRERRRRAKESQAERFHKEGS